MSDVSEKCRRIIKFAPSSMVDGYARKQLEYHIRKYRSKTETKLADIAFKFDGYKYQSLLDALYDISEWDEMEIHFHHPNTQERWEYNIPTKLIKITHQGKGGLMYFPINPFALKQWNPDQKPAFESAMFRCYLSYFYSPESIKSQSNKFDEKPLVPPRPLCSPLERWKDIRNKGIVPFQMTLCAYTHKRRFIYQLDILDNAQLMDFRDGKIPIANRTFRHSMDYYHLDNLLSTQELPDLAKKVLQVFFELEDAIAADIEIGLGITEKMARDHIRALVTRGLIEAIGKPPKAKYVIDLENIRKLADEGG